MNVFVVHGLHIEAYSIISVHEGWFVRRQEYRTDGGDSDNHLP